MKLSWKLFFITTPVFILFLTVFGTWMIQENFQNSLDQEIERCMVENQMFQNSYELTGHGLSEDQRSQVSTKKIVETFYRKQGDTGSTTRIYGKDGEILYQSNARQLTHDMLDQLDETNNVGYELFDTNDGQFVVVLCLTASGEYIETTKNITGIFEQRSDMYSAYQMGVLLLAVVVGGVILGMMFFVMRNMQKLSSATRQFARGRYDVRVHIRSRDEVGMLAEDFNWMANAMNQQMERLQSEVKRQEEFTAAFAHELKTPLTSIIGYADTIRQMELSPEETDMCADYIYRQGKRLQSLSYKLLEMTMAGKQKIEWKELHAPELLGEVAQIVETSLHEKQMTLLSSVQDGIIYGDRELLSSVFVNLIDNARKASEPGSVIHLYGAAVPGGYSVIVEDQGRGIPQEELARITEAFYMVDKSRARKEGGAGLGLALCQKIIDLHQGSWQMESEPGHGLRVTVRFGVPDEKRRERRNRRTTRNAESMRIASGKDKKAKQRIRSAGTGR